MYGVGQGHITADDFAEAAVALQVEETGLNPAELALGIVLSCARVAEGDVLLDVEDLGDVVAYPVKTYPAKIKLIEHMNADVIKVIFRLPPSQKIDYHPGQYLDVISKTGLRRSYSMANAPSEGREIELHIKEVKGGAMSEYWFGEAAENILLRLNGPLGTFFLRDVAGLHLVFIATGTGIAPIKAMIEGLSRLPVDKLPISISVFWGARVVGDLYWDPIEIGVKMKYFPVLSRADSSWNGLRGYAPKAVIESGIEMQNAAVYACGSIAMIESAQVDLVNAGLDPHRFYSDAFVASSHTY